MRYFCAAVIAALCFPVWSSCAAAQDVTLTSRDGSVELSGTLLSYDGEFYRLDTRFGELTVDGTSVSCDGPGCPNLSSYVAEIAFSGSSVMAELLLPALIEGFALRSGYRATRVAVDPSHFEYELRDLRTDKLAARFLFRSTTTDEGFADLLADEADLAMALREMRPDERERAVEAGLGEMSGTDRARILALDAMVPVVAQSNPLRVITTPDLARVYAGEVTNWSQLGGPDAPVAVHLPGPGSGLAQAAEDYLLVPGGLTIGETVIRDSLNSSVIDPVIADPFAIGLASFAESGSTRVLDLSGGCGHVLAATRRSIKTEDYPLTTPMFLYLPARRLPKIGRAFLAYTTTPSAQIVIRRAGFVDQSTESIPVNAQGDRFANAVLAAGPEIGLGELQRMVRVLRPMERLTLTFRFEAGSARPDAQSRANVDRLASAIGAGEFDGRQLLFVGFSDGDGSAAANLRIALARAEQVRDAVLEISGIGAAEQIEIGVDAFGEALPMACDDSDWGRKINRRVEIWLR